jgi:DNA-binding MurR/RpiR family transcriptional regulator
MPANELLQRIDERRDALTDVDHKLVQVLAGNPAEAPYFSARELADRAGVHESSSIRLAQKLGFAGFPAMRQALRQAAAPNDAAQRVANTLTAAENDSVLAMLRGKELEALAQSAHHVDQAQIDRAADALLKARHIYVWAAGNAKVLAELLDRRLRSAGFPSRDISFEGRELAERLVLVGKNDAVIAFAFRHQPAPFSTVIEHAEAVGAKSIAIADMVAHTLSARPNHLLAAPRGDDETFLTLTVPMLITNALFLTLAKHDKSRSIEGLKTLQRLRAALDVPD